jgi:hypothetical protein
MFRWCSVVSTTNADTDCMKRFLLQKLTVANLVKRLAADSETQKFISVFTRA